MVLGENCRRIRTKIGITQDQLALHARDVGLRWNAAKVGNFEAGRSAPTFATVLAVTAALQWALEDAAERRGMSGADLLSSELPGVTLADLVTSDGRVALTDAFEVRGRDLDDVCRRGLFFTLEPSVYARPRPLRRPPDPFGGGPEGMPPDPFGGIPEGMRKRDTRSKAAVIEVALQRSGLTEQRLAKRLNVSPTELARASFRLWQSTFSEERDRRAGPDANQQKKGRVSRELRAALEKALG